MGTLNEDLTSIKTVEDTLTRNKVARFSYTEQAYTDNNADGVDVYIADKEQNIPNGTASILRVNDTVLSKGYRAQASSVTRMLLNHFLGRLSYNLNKVNDNMSNLLTTLQSHLGTANGFASLDENGRIPYSQLPESAIEFKGTWNAETNTPTLVDGVGVKGDMYLVSVEGSQTFNGESIFFSENDRIIYDGYVWTKLAGSNVKKVNNLEPNEEGNIEIYGTDIPTTNGKNISITEALKKCIGSTLLGRYWVKSNITSGNYLTPIYANGIWVTVNGGSFGSRLFYSTNGTYWINSNFTSNANLSIQYVKDIWIAYSTSITGAGVYYSTDGKTWTQSNLTSGYYNRCKYSNGKFILSGRGNGIYYSTDGKSWTQSNVTGGNFGEPTYSSELWVVGSNGYGIYYSTDGMSWTQTNLTSGYYSSPLFAKGVWSVTSSGNGIYYSTDGKSWTQSNLTSGALAGITYDNDVWIAYSSSANTGLYYSTDGKSWTQSNLTSGDYTEPIYSNGLWILGSKESTNKGIYYSVEGKTWTQTNVTKVAFSGITYVNGTWLASSASSSDSSASKGLYYSAEGKTWLQSNITYGYCTTPKYANGILITVHGSDGGIKYSNVDTLINKGWLQLDI